MLNRSITRSKKKKRTWISSLYLYNHSPTSRSSFQWMEDTMRQCQVVCRICFPYRYSGTHIRMTRVAIPAMEP